MITHHPYGIDDPYKTLATERFPRDPAPGDEVQVGFEISPDAAHAWVILTEAGQDRCVPAVRLNDTQWSASLGRLGSGAYTYQMFSKTDEEEVNSDAFTFEVGHWVQPEGIQAVEATGESVVLHFQASGTAARYVISFPHEGVCRTELLTGPQDPVSVQGKRCDMREEDSRIIITSEGIQLTIDRTTLDITASLPGAPSPAFTGSLRSRWLMTSANEATRIVTSFTTEPDEWLYGLGERFTQANRRGERWDVRVYEEYKEQDKRTYIPVPLLVSTRNYGLWLQADEPSHFDLTASECTITIDKLPAEQTSLPLHIIVAPEPYAVTAAFTRLTGEIRVPPKWAFGPWMSANTWNNQARTEEVVNRTLHEDVPSTVLVLEAWSDESTFYIFNDAEYDPKPGGEALRLKDFRFGGRWPDPKALVDHCHANGIRVLLWQIPVQKKLDEPHPQHDLDEMYMLEHGYYIRNEDGTPYRNQGWWFTDALIIDFTHPEASDWWFLKRKYLFDELGIDGMKTDGGEHLWGRGLQAFDGRRGLQLFNRYPNLYVGAYHDFVQQRTDGDGLTFSRAGYTGAQQYPCHWAGDENSTWNAYKASIQAGLSAGVSGLSMWGWDIGGFSGEIPPVELYIRSTAMAAFCPIMQYHSELHNATECRDRSPWNIAERHNDPRALTIYRKFAQLRMRLLDYIYEEAQVLSEQGRPLMRYPALDHPDAHAFLSADPYAFMFGRDLLVAPVTEKGATTRDVRLPPGEWVDIWSGARMSGNRTVLAPAPLDRIPVYVRADSPRLEILRVAARND